MSPLTIIYLIIFPSKYNNATIIYTNGNSLCHKGLYSKKFLSHLASSIALSEATNFASIVEGYSQSA